MSRLEPDRLEVADTASRAAAKADAFARRLNAQTYSRDTIVRTVRDITGDADSISAAGERSAEQAVMAANSLLLACSPPLPQSDALQGRIDAMFKQLENPSAYNAPTFASNLKALSSLLP